MATAIEIGKRCRKFRNALGISQQALADIVGTTPQNISKYEKEGVYNIETIQELSKALGYDLLSDEMESSGKVGEIGLEILCFLVNYRFPFSSSEGGGGFIDTKCLLEKNILYGLGEDGIVHEIFKLQKLGLCVREQYTDFYGDTIDRLFITAKGVITLKHIVSSEEILINLSGVETYEMMCGDCSSYQEYVDSHVLEKKIRNLPMETAFRANFIHYLHRNYEKGMDKYRMDMNMSPNFFPGENCYFDIMFHMMIGFTNDEAENLFEIINNYDTYDEDVMEEMHNISSDEVEFNSKYRLKQHISRIDMDEENSGGYDLKEDEEERFMLRTPDVRYQEVAQKHKQANPFKWFGKNEIETFIRENILPANTNYEKKVESEIIEIMTMEPQIISDYFRFPKEWEENGLANIVRSIFKVPGRN